MWRAGRQQWYRTAGGRGEPVGPQVVAVAIDGDKSSQQALKWAADHVLTREHIFFLLHVRRYTTTIPTPTGHQIPISEVEEEVASAFLEQMDHQTKQILLPFQCYCSRRGLQYKEVILDDTDVPKAIVDFAMHQTADKLILGASLRNLLARTFKQADVPTSVLKIAPEFCTVYVISKGKISSIRPAIRPNLRPISKTACEYEIAGNKFQSVKSAPDARHNIGPSKRYPLLHSEAVAKDSSSGSSARNYDKPICGKISEVSQAGEHLEFSYQSVASCPNLSRTSIDKPSCYFSRGFLDREGQQSRLSNMSNVHTDSNEKKKGFGMNGTGGAIWPSGSRASFNVPQEDLESEIRRLKLELKMARDVYDDASNEAPCGKADAELRLGEVTLAEGTTLEMAETKNQSSKRMLEVAQAAQEKMEIEATKAINGENLFQEMTGNTKFLDVFYSDVRYKRYTVEEIQKATENFSDSLKIGEGGYGPVFKSTLDHTLVAIKILRPDAAQGMKQFQQEVEVLSCIRHPNMVLLMGACPEYGCLVYEYMANGSLEDRLFCRSGSSPLSWQLRFKIAAEIASGLIFLHRTKPEPFVHRDLKPGNILLDHDYVSKIADVGLARLIPYTSGDSATQYHITAAAGTFCYIDPEYQKTGMLGIKSDIYALGIILLQLITAQSAMGIAHNVERAIEMDKFKEILDPNVPNWPMEETIKLAELALKCAELQQKDRPDLGSVVLPELNRLRALALSTEEAPWRHQCQRAKSYKETYRGHPTGMSQFLDNGIVGGTSFIQ